MHGAKHGGFQAAEGKVIGVKTTSRKRNSTLRQGITLTVSAFGGQLNGGASGVTKPQQSRHFVERFSSRIVVAATEPIHTPLLGYTDQFRVSTAHQQNQVGRLRLPLRQLHRGQVTFQVMHPQECTSMQSCQGAAGDRSHHQCPSKTRGDRCCHGINPIQ